VEVAMVFCAACGEEYPNGTSLCPECRVPLTGGPADERAGGDLGALIRTSLLDPVAIALAKSLLDEAGVAYFVMGQNTAARQESGNVMGWWSIRVPVAQEAEAREIVGSVEQMK
jgi:hypothetical protein